MKRPFILAMVATVVALAIGMAVAVQGNVQARDEFSADITYRDAARTQPVEVALTYRLSRGRTEEFRIRSTGGTLPVQWTASEGGPAITVEVWKGAGLVQRLTPVGADCARWQVDGDGDYLLRIIVPSGTGAFRLAWQEAAAC